MAWTTCPHCGFTQITALDCLRCGRRMSRPAGQPATPPEPPAPRAGPKPTFRLPIAARSGLALGAAAAVLIGIVLFLTARSSRPRPADALPPAATPEPWTLDLSGTWKARATTTIPGAPPRPALREVTLETDPSGNVVSASALLTDPGRGGAGAGYMTVPDGLQRVRDISAAVAGDPRGAAVELDFIPLPPWVPRRDRLWRAIEGMRRRPEETDYLLLESVEKDYLIQAGVNGSGFLSYAFFSPEYAAGRGTDVLSRVIHPAPESSLRGFRNLIWDLSGSADFVDLQVHATISGPAGGADQVLLRR
jgi:hypothetical protein